VQLFAVSHSVRGVTEQSLLEGVQAAGSAFPSFGDGEPWSATSRSGNVVVAAVHHPEQLVGPRRYRARVDDVAVAFDGLPVHRSGAWRGHDAEALLAHWQELPDALEGQFTALRVDLATDDVVLLTDSFGIAPLYALKAGDGYVVANSVEALRLAGGLDAPSPLGVSSFAALGWPAGDTTLVSGVRALAGGHEYRLSRNGLVEVPYLTPGTVAASARSGLRISTDQIVRELLELTTSAVSAGIPTRCGLTAGRDTRVLLALLRATGAGRVEYYTGGSDGQPDVDGARLLARELGLEHEVRSLDVLDAADWRTLTGMFVSQTDGMSTLMQIADYHDQLSAPETLGLKVPGLGGEFGRCGVGPVPYATNVPLFAFSSRLQSRLISEWTRTFRGLWTADALDQVGRYVTGFVADRRAEGWKVREVSEAYYVFDRVSRWGSTSTRRIAGAEDVFSPFCSRAFVTYCFSLTPEERYVEASHYRLLSALSPRLRDLPFAKPWRRQSRARVPFEATFDLAKMALDKSQRFQRRSGESAPAPPPYWAKWFDAHADEHLELCMSVPDSALWSWIDRSAVERAFRAEPPARARVREGLARVATLFWYFHGRR
jgi:hypothetical protein